MSTASGGRFALSLGISQCFNEFIMSIATLSATQLRKAADLKDRIGKLETQLNLLLGSSAASAKPAKKKGGMSAAGRAAVAAAQRARWAKINSGKSKSVAKQVKKERKKMSAEARAKIAAAQKARWAKQKSEKK